MPVQQPPAIQMPAAPKLYATPETRLRLGFLTSVLAGWAGRDVIVISRQDIRNLAGPAFADQASRQLKAGNAKFFSDIFNTVTSRLGYDYHPPRLTSGRDDGGIIDLHTAAALETTLADTGATVAMNSTDVTAGTSNLCVISMPETDSADKILETFIQMNPSQARFDLNRQDLVNFIFAHETGHCGQYMAMPTLGGILKREIEADQHAMTVLPMIYPAHILHYKLQQIVDMRTLEFFHHIDEGHATVPALNMAGGKPDYQPFVQYMMKTPFGSARKDYLEHHPDLTQDAATNDEGFLDVIAKAGDYLAAKLGVEKRESSQLLQTDHRLMYETLKTLKLAGAFDGSNLETRYVDRYLQAMESHGATDPDAARSPVVMTPKPATPPAQPVPPLQPRPHAPGF